MSRQNSIFIKYNFSNTPGHSNRVFSVKFLPDVPNTFISGGWDGNVLIWDLRERKAVGSIHGPNLTGDSLDYKNGHVLTGSYRTKD
jgi:WD40 repeat protein